MPNNITPFKRYTSLLDEVYQNASVTSMLDMNGAHGAHGHQCQRDRDSQD